MKKIATVVSICSLSMGTVVHADLEDDYTNQIIQIQKDPTNPEGELLIYPVVVGTAGQMDAVAPIYFGESTFELWSVKNDSPENPKLLDATSVNGYYSPEIWIDSLDPSSTPSSPRTRADRPYTVRIEGVSAEFVGNAAASLQMVWNGEDLPDDDYKFPESHETNYSGGTPVNSLLPTVLSGSLDFDAYAPDQTEVWSRETFSLWEKDDTGTPILSSRYVTIWPTATIGFEPGKALTDGATYRVFPEIQVNFINLYAVDNWYVWAVSEDGTSIPIHDGSVDNVDMPAFRPARITEKLNDLITKSGTYTLYGGQKVPGLDSDVDPKRLGSFTFNAEIKVRANVISSE